MSKLRRTKLLEKMYRRVATHEEIALVDKLYSENNKGSATRVMLEKVSKIWFELLDTSMKTESKFEDLTPLINPI